MAIFTHNRKKIGEKETQYVAVLTPQHIGSFLSLYCLANEISKTSVINPLLLAWMEKELEKGTELLINRLIEKAKAHYQHQRKTVEGVSLLSFQNELFKELQSKGLDVSVIKMITNQIA